jgi:hypothetical protein
MSKLSLKYQPAAKASTGLESHTARLVQDVSQNSGIILCSGGRGGVDTAPAPVAAPFSKVKVTPSHITRPKAASHNHGGEALGLRVLPEWNLLLARRQNEVYENGADSRISRAG